MAASTTSQTAKATQVQTAANRVSAGASSRVPTAALHAAYIPTGKTVAQRATS